MSEKVEIIIEGKDRSSPAFDSARKSAGGLGAALKSAGTMAVGFGGAMVGLKVVGGIFGAVGDAAIGLNSQLEQSRIAFTTMLGSADAAQAHLDELAKFAAKTPFEFPDLVTASKRLMAFGFQADEVIPLMTSIGNAAAAMGGGAEMIGRITTALGQMSAKGKVSAEEMMQLTESGLPAWDMLAKKLGVDVAEAMKLVEKRAVDARVMIDAFQEGTAGRFGNMMEAQSKTFAGAMSTVKDSLMMAIADAAKPFFSFMQQGMVDLAGVLTGDIGFDVFASNMISNIGKLITDMGQKLDTLASGFAAWIMPATSRMMESLPGLADRLLNWLVDQGPTIAETFLSEWLPAALIWIARAAIDIIPKLAELLYRITEWIVLTAVPKLGEFALKMGIAIVKGIVLGLGRLGYELAVAITDALRNLRIDFGPFHIDASGFRVDTPSFSGTGASTMPEASIYGYASGGIVPGPRGVPQLALVHGGETITPPGQSIDYDRLASVLQAQPIVLRIDSEDLVVRGYERARRRGRIA